MNVPSGLSSTEHMRLTPQQPAYNSFVSSPSPPQLRHRRSSAQATLARFAIEYRALRPEEGDPRQEINYSTSLPPTKAALLCLHRQAQHTAVKKNMILQNNTH
jgi:hypothetical protein